jgi:hypothetical protein
MLRLFSITAVAASSIGLTGCMSPVVNDQASLYRHDVQPVMTEHSLALACLGELIDQSGRPRLTVYVDSIDDKTVPIRFEDRRLSLGGAYWLHTAINKIGSERVVSTTSRSRGNKAANSITLSGAWTQDDLGVGRTEGNFDGEWNGSSVDANVFLGARRLSDVIAGDFITIRNGVVTHATAISLAIDDDRSGFGLRIEDGPRDWAFDLTRSTVEGPQFAQRRITEAAALVHLSKAFDIDYRPCIDVGWAGSANFQERASEYFTMSVQERHRTMQTALNEAGYNAGPADGVWGARSVRALMAFQSDRGLPVTGRPSSQVYLALQRPKGGLMSALQP